MYTKFRGPIRYDKQGIDMRTREFALTSSEWVLLGAGIWMRVLASNSFLNLFFPYTALGGSAYLKIHPGSYVILFVFLSLLVRVGPIRIFFLQFKKDLWALQFLVVVSSLSLVLVLRFGTAGLAYLVDTFIVSAIVAILLWHVHEKSQANLAKALIAFVIVNSLIALVEYGLQTHMMPYDQYARFFYFRSSAFLGHPLTNALITVPALILISAHPWSIQLRWFGLSVCFGALLAFGARAALVIAVFAFTVAQILDPWRRLLRGRLNVQHASALLLLGPIVLVCAYYLTFSTGLGARIAGMIDLKDTSAAARFSVFSIFEYLTVSEMWFGSDTTSLALAVERNPYFSIVENFWVGLIASFGILMFVPFVVSFLWFLGGVVAGRGHLVVFSLIAFLLVASSNNSLSSKSPALLIFICLAGAVCKRDEVGIVVVEEANHE